MSSKVSAPVVAVLPAIARGLLEPHLPAGIEPRWFASPEEAKAAMADATIAWVDMQPTRLAAETIRAGGPKLRWVSTLYAGLDAFPLDWLRERDVTVTNGGGINAVAVAEYAVMGMLVAAKRFDRVVRSADAREWPWDAPGKVELDGTRALIVGQGTIGRAIADRLAGFGVATDGVTRSGRDGTLTPDQWRARLGEYDWLILAAPSTADTRAMIGADELAAMKPTAWLVNIARGDMIDQDALLTALDRGTIAGAFLDPTDPEPLPADHPLWTAPNAILSMHLSGRSQSTMFARAGRLFLDNLAAWQAGKRMQNVVDLAAGY
ncbi:D-2-hydroxyacid dehydrogenase [Sphingomonas sp. KR1UV-12]|uniref:D-2-hydroxyacid dehydrogenase n=1 Tax=Sphingomonas aurea TaxID=3063994 RepID=A0ABT9EI94_9SPHN|nr:D-2-hydroxyacid dehydrogenase [Sphingomonas sp. KR1UV-12]MDP1026685.1 D-2-hydroxyacid dehydrogenase [Sphingomonas sp. KR1UV-12]